MGGFVCVLFDRRASLDRNTLFIDREHSRRNACPIARAAEVMVGRFPRSGRATPNHWRKAGLLVAALVVFAPALAALEDPVTGDAAALLAKMSVAVRDTRYQGSFIYEHDGRIDALRIFHAGGRDGRERLLSMSGARSEVVRDGNTITCMQAGSPALLLPNFGAAHLLPLVPVASGPSFGKFYAVELGREDRVAGYQTRIVKVVPRDAYRYGYRLWLEDSTQLLLRSAVIDAAGHDLEQFMFVALEIGAKPKESDLVPSVETGAMTALEETALVAVPQWRVADAPAGFELLRAQQASHGTNRGEHLMYSDGVASVSVYVEPRDAKTPQAVDRAIARGMLSIYTHDMGEWKITVLGDVPRATAQRMARSVQATATAVIR